MLARWLRRAGAAPLPPGPRGRVLFVGPFHGGVGGIERLTKTFSTWADGSGYATTFVFQDGELGRTPYSVAETERCRVLAGRDWGRALEDEYDWVYVVPAGLDAPRWKDRLARVRGPKVMLDLDPKRKLGTACDVLHWETPRDQVPDRPFVVATPDPRPTIPEGPQEPPEETYLTVFTPYGDVKGHRHVREFLEGSDRRLAWCYDPITFARRKGRWLREIRSRVDEARHPRLRTFEAPSLAQVYRLYRTCRGYVCFSEEESMGYAMLDALALGKPLCARRIGICRALDGFKATEDFSRPVFERYPLPETVGFEGLFRRVEALLAGARPQAQGTYAK